MKRLSLAIIFACFTLAVAAQEGFRVDYQGTRPTIKDFVKAYALPRTGKDIIVATWHEDGKKTQKTLKWNGHGFSYLTLAIYGCVHPTQMPIPTGLGGKRGAGCRVFLFLSYGIDLKKTGK